jgi:hypothetical protein
VEDDYSFAKEYSCRKFLRMPPPLPPLEATMDICDQ